ncbi:MAG TPA: DNA recombination protein RmuC [Tenericutes bacterium]|jgi:DNA recombination protein RmuC|nr:DNA recombination protein RmuC [Mycoplasmatota bacterium]
MPLELIFSLIFILLIIVIVILILKDKKTSSYDLIERLAKIETNINKDLSEFNEKLREKLTEDFDKLSDRVEGRLIMINDKVNERLEEGFEKTNKTFTNIIERLSKIDEAQKKIESLSTDIVLLQSILTDKKSRGIFGEVQLEHILASIFGKKNEQIYKMQYKLSNNTIADAVLFAPDPLGTVVIDSKFPLENYRLMVDRNKSDELRGAAEKRFVQDVKTHIDAISSKYILPGETSDQAIMFLPAEAIFAEINAYHPELIEYANSKRVWIVSPTTMMSTLTIIQVIIRNLERDKYASIIHEELQKLGLEFNRYRERWDKLSRHIQTVSEDVKDIHVTTTKIGKRFDSISKVEIGDSKIIDVIDEEKLEEIKE